MEYAQIRYRKRGTVGGGWFHFIFHSCRETSPRSRVTVRRLLLDFKQCGAMITAHAPRMSNDVQRLTFVVPNEANTIQVTTRMFESEGLPVIVAAGMHLQLTVVTLPPRWNWQPPP